jgi:hypothetical protein
MVPASKIMDGFYIITVTVSWIKIILGIRVHAIRVDVIWVDAIRVDAIRVDSIWVDAIRVDAIRVQSIFTLLL